MPYAARSAPLQWRTDREGRARQDDPAMIALATSPAPTPHAYPVPKGCCTLIGEINGLGCAAGWAVISTAMKAASKGLGPVMVNGVRCGFATLVLAAIVIAAGLTHDLVTLPVDALAAIIISGLLGQAIGDGMFINSLKLIGASRALPITGINPILTMALAMVFLGERVTLIGASGTFLVVGGIYMLAFPYGKPKQQGNKTEGADRLGILMALGAAAAYAGSAIVLKAGIANVDLIVANLVRMSAATIFLLVLETFHSRGRITAGLTRKSVAMLGLAGALNGVTGLMYLTALIYAGAAKAAVLVSTSPLFALPLSIILLRERVNRRILIGTALSIVGIWMVMWG